MLSAVAAMAAPRLRLETAAAGPYHTDVGQNAAQQSVDAFNAGDGSLSLTLSSNASWLTAATGPTHSCEIVVATCIPINFTFTTSTMARGLYTGVVTVTSPNTVDAPQTITVSVQVGSGVPDSMDLYVAPGAKASATVTSASALLTKVTSPATGPTLSVSGAGEGSFAYNHSYQVIAQAPASATDGDYPGSIAVSGSASATDNKNVPVTVHVTSQPIATPSPQKILFRVAQGGAKATQYIVLGNSGLGTLAVSSVSFGSTAPPPWLSVSTTANLVALTADPTGLSPGTQTAIASVASNARNGAVTVPIELDVLAPGPPITNFQGVLDNATFSGGSLAPGEIVALFGEQLTGGGPVQASSLPLGTSLGAATVSVNGQAAPVYFVSANQIDFLIPYETAAGTALVSVSRGGQAGNTVTTSIVPVAPVILPLGIGNYGNIVLADFVTRPIPPTPGLATRAAQAGVDVITIYALGLGHTTPAVADGVAAPGSEPLARVPYPQVVFGDPYRGPSGTPNYAGLTPGLVGLYQVNVTVPSNSPRGSAVPLIITTGAVVSNSVVIAVTDPAPQ